MVKANNKAEEKAAEQEQGALQESEVLDDAMPVADDVSAASGEGAAPADETAPAEEDAPAASTGLEHGASDISDTSADVEDGEDEEYDEVDSEDSLTYSNGVIEKIVAMATREVPHVLGMKGNLVHFFQEQLGAENLTKGVSVEVTDDNRMIINISVIIEYGCYAPDIFEGVKARVTERLAEMTGLEVAGINLRIEDVVTREEYEASRKKFIDSLMHENGEE